MFPHPSYSSLRKDLRSRAADVSNVYDVFPNSVYEIFHWIKTFNLGGFITLKKHSLRTHSVVTANTDMTVCPSVPWRTLILVRPSSSHRRSYRVVDSLILNRLPLMVPSLCGSTSRRPQITGHRYCILHCFLVLFGTGQDDVTAGICCTW